MNRPIARNDNGAGWWQIVGMIVLTAMLSSLGSGIVSGYLAAQAVADRVVVDQGKAISALENRATAIEVLSERAIVQRLDEIDERLDKLEANWAAKHFTK